MYGKFFSSTFTGSMFGAGPDVFAVWAYVIAHTVDSAVELNPALLGAILGTTPDRVLKAIEYLCSPDSSSRNKDCDGCRLVHEGGFQYRVVSHALYRVIRNEEDRRAYNRQKQRESRARRKQSSPSKPVSLTVNDGQSLSTLSANTEAEAETEAEAKKNSPKKPGSFSKPPELKNGPKTNFKANSSQEPLGRAEGRDKLQPHHAGSTEGRKGPQSAKNKHSSEATDSDSGILPEMVVSGIMQELRLGGMHLRVALTEVVAACMAGGDAPDALKDRVVKRWRFYLKSAGALNYTLGFEKWIASGSWDTPEAWPWKNGQAPKQQRWKYADGGAD